MFVITDKPIKYLTTNICDKMISYNLQGINIINKKQLIQTIRSTYSKENKAKQYQTFLLKYEKQLTPLFKLVAFEHRKITDSYNLTFIVKRHSRTILPYKKEIKFNIPATRFECMNILPSSEYDKRPNITMQLEHNIFRSRRWTYGNVYDSQEICFGYVKPVNFYDLIKNAPVSKDPNDINTQVLYLNIYMSYIYSMFFDIPFNLDLVDKRRSFISLIDFRDTDTRLYIENYLKEKHPDNEYLQKHNYSLVYLRRKRKLNEFLDLLDITNVKERR